MITLNTTASTINVTSSNSGISLDCLVERKIVTPTALTAGSNSTVITTTSQTTIQAGDASGQVVVGYISIYNNSAVTTTVTIKHYDGTSVNAIIYKADLSQGDKIEYTDSGGFSVQRSQAVTISGNTIRATLASTQVSNTNVLGSSGLTISTQASKVYKFEAFVTFSSDVITTGIKLGLIDTGAGSVTGTISGLINNSTVATELKMPLIAMTDSIITTGVNPINIPHTAKLEFIYSCTTGGSVTLSFCAEALSANVSLLVPTYLIATVI